MGCWQCICSRNISGDVHSVSLPEEGEDQACKPARDCDLPVHGQFALQMCFPHKPGAARQAALPRHPTPIPVCWALNVPQAAFPAASAVFQPRLVGTSGQSSQLTPALPAQRPPLGVEMPLTQWKCCFLWYLR